MRTLHSRVARLEARTQAQEAPRFTIETDGPPMSDAEIDAYNRRRKPHDPFLFTIRIDRREDDPASRMEGEP